jgi:hypothetical protein
MYVCMDFFHHLISLSIFQSLVKYSPFNLYIV